MTRTDTMRDRKNVHYPADDRPTMRVFYAPKEKTPQKRHEDALEARIAELEAYVTELEDALLVGAP